MNCSLERLEKMTVRRNEVGVCLKLNTPLTPLKRGTLTHTEKIIASQAREDV